MSFPDHKTLALEIQIVTKIRKEKAADTMAGADKPKRQIGSQHPMICQRPLPKPKMKLTFTEMLTL